MAALAAVARGEAHEDGLSVVGGEVYAHGGPVFPQHLVGGLVPAEAGVGYEVGHRAGVYGLAVLVEDLQAEAGLQRGRVLGVLEDGGVAQHQQVGDVGVDGHAVGDALGFGGGVAAAVPVAEAHGGLLALRYGAQAAAGAGVALGGVKVHGVAAGGAEVAVVDGADVGCGVAEAAVAAGHVGGMQVGVVYAARAALRGEGVEGVCGHGLGAVAASGAAVGGVEHVVGQRREAVDAAWRHGGVRRRQRGVADGAVADAHRRRAFLLPLDGDVVGLHFRHAEPIGRAGGHQEVVNVGYVVVLEAQDYEVAVAVVVGQVEEAPLVGPLQRREGGQRVEGLRVAGVAHGAEGQAVAVAAREAGVEGHREAPQAVGVGLGQHQIGGAQVVADLEG